MIKHFLFLLICISIYSCSWGQGFNNIYLFGYTGPVRGTIDMYSGAPVVITDSVRTSNLSYTHANISDKNGNLLFYTNGVVVLDGDHDTMPNGTGLNPCTYTTNNSFYGLNSTQADIIIPFPNDTSKYYLLHQSLDNISTYTGINIYYSIIDMKLNGGKGDVVQKNSLFYQDTLFGGGLTACKHANGRDWWLIVPKEFSPGYIIFLLSPSGIQYSTTQYIGNRSDFGQAAFSPDGTHFGFKEFRKDLQIFDFDRCSGLLSNYKLVPLNDSLWGDGFSFSSNSRLAYATSAHFLYQINLDSINIAGSLKIVSTWDGTYNPIQPLETGFDYMQIGPDNKIYMTTSWATQRMQFINYPDSIGIACDMQQHSIILPTYNHNTIPNFPNYFLGPVIGSVCDSLGLGITESIYDKDLNLKVNPNPADNSFYLNYELPTCKDAVLYIYNAPGQKIFEQRIFSVNKSLWVHCDTWLPGVYFVKVVMEHDGFSACSKVVVY
jgi:hypothetical protein